MKDEGERRRRVAGHDSGTAVGRMRRSRSRRTSRAWSTARPEALLRKASLDERVAAACDGHVLMTAALRSQFKGEMTVSLLS